MVENKDKTKTKTYTIKEKNIDKIKEISDRFDISESKVVDRLIDRTKQEEIIDKIKFKETDDNQS